MMGLKFLLKFQMSDALMASRQLLITKNDLVNGWPRPGHDKQEYLCLAIDRMRRVDKWWRRRAYTGLRNRVNYEIRRCYHFQEDPFTLRALFYRQGKMSNRTTEAEYIEMRDEWINWLYHDLCCEEAKDL